MAQKTSIPIVTLSGGVSRQPDSKRTPIEAQELDNCMVSVERSFEKRPGFSVLPGVGTYDLSFLPHTADPHFNWFQIDRDTRYLIIVDRNATEPASSLFYVVQFIDQTWSLVSSAMQWDPTDSQLVWNGTDIISETDQRYPIYSKAVTDPGSGSLSSKYNALLAQGVVSKITRNYLTYGSGEPREVIKALQVGQNVMYLNTKVYAGFTSGLDNKKVDLGGLTTTEDDVRGRHITYYTALRVRKTTDGRLYPDGTVLEDGDEWDAEFTTKFVPIEDYIYGDFDRPWIGQSVKNFSELRFPPDKDDWIANNGNLDISDSTAQDMLIELYDPEHPHKDEVDGNGKIYYCAEPYLSMPAGYYRIINFPETETYAGPPSVDGTGMPYTQRVRTPDNCSVIDHERMPQILLYNSGQFSMQPIDWSPRTSGDMESNPGPSPFIDPITGDARHVLISSICNFRDRLFLSCGDVIFSSQLGVINNLWIDDPSNITVSDPIDVRAASNTYAEITAMVPFDKYLFINTKGSVQFELKGDNNLISPTTAEISATTFYSTANLVEPQTLGSQIYFWDVGRLYIYFNNDSRGFNTATEVSYGIHGYLPDNFGDTATASAQNYLLAVDNDEPNNIYIYCNRFSGNQLMQSAFWRYILDPSDSVVSINAWDKNLYAVSRKTVENATAWYVLSTLLEQEAVDVPRLDYRTQQTITESSLFIRNMDSTFSVPYILDNTMDTFVVLTDDFGAESGSAFKATSVEVTGLSTLVTISGINLSRHIGKKIYVGNNYTMRAQLSTVYQRDNANNIVEGRLSLRTLNTRHTNTGSYRVEVTRRGRPNKLISEFSATDGTDLTIEANGTFVSQVFGFSDDVEVAILSDALTPCNITQMEFRGIFSKINSAVR